MAKIFTAIPAPLMCPCAGATCANALLNRLADRMLHGSDYPGSGAWALGMASRICGLEDIPALGTNPNVLERDYPLKLAMGFPPDAFFTCN